MTARKTTGFTMIEMTLGMAITAVIGLTVAAMSFGISRSYETQDASFRSLQNSRAAMNRVQSELRIARLVAGAGTDEVVLWTEDLNGDGAVNLFEVTTLEYDRQTGTLTKRWVEAPTNVSPILANVLNFSLSLDTTTRSTDAVVSYQESHFWAHSQVLATNLTDFSVGCDKNAPQSQLVKIHLSSGEGGTAADLRTVVHLRSDDTDRLTTYRGSWTLLSD